MSKLKARDPDFLSNSFPILPFACWYDEFLVQEVNYCNWFKKKWNSASVFALNIEFMWWNTQLTTSNVSSINQTCNKRKVFLHKRMHWVEKCERKKWLGKLKSEEMWSITCQFTEKFPRKVVKKYFCDIFHHNSRLSFKVYWFCSKRYFFF